MKCEYMAKLIEWPMFNYYFVTEERFCVWIC